MARLGDALRFVNSKGNEVEIATLGFVLEGRTPSKRVVDQLLDGQREDGGWSPPWAGDYSSLDATCYKLDHAKHLGLNKEEPRVRKALVFLSQRQGKDGGYGEDAKFTRQAPGWAKPGSEDAKIYLTASCGFWQAVLEGDHEAARAASDYLQARLSPEGRLPTFPHGHWLAGGLWYKIGERDLAERVFGYLSSEVSRLSASNHGWMISTLYFAGVPTEHALLRVSASLLDHSQRGDGSWQAEDGPMFDAHATTEAVAALHFCKSL